jgi:hypothetical protein
MRTHVRWRTRLPFVLGATVLVVGLAAATLGAAPYSYEPDDICDAALPEGSSYGIESNWWPPGTQTCHYTTAAGRQGESTHIPWTAWASVLLLALGVATCASFMLPGASQRPVRLLAGVAALLGGIAVWFV